MDENDDKLLDELLREDSNLGDKQSEEGLEYLAKFNQDMGILAMNVYEIYSLFDLVNKENEEIVDWMLTLEKQAVEIEERH